MQTMLFGLGIDMKRIILGSLSTLLLVGVIAPAGFAQSGGEVCNTSPTGNATTQSPVSMDNTANRMNVRDTEAFNLVSLAYRGEFEDMGIPSYNRLVTEYTTGDLSGYGRC
jgi:hypothetical protein